MWEKTNKVLQEYAILVRNQYQDSLIKNNRIATGNLLNSVEYDINVGEKQIKVSLNLPEYWKYVEWDTKPHFPPIDKIVKYIEEKPIYPHEDKNGNLPTPKQLAFLIGRAMAGKSPNQASLKNPQGGTTGTHDLANTLEEVNKIYLEKIEEAILEDVNEDIISIILGIRSFK